MVSGFLLIHSHLRRFLLTALSCLGAPQGQVLGPLLFFTFLPLVISPILMALNTIYALTILTSLSLLDLSLQLQAYLSAPRELSLCQKPCHTKLIS